MNSIVKNMKNLIDLTKEDVYKNHDAEENTLDNI